MTPPTSLTTAFGVKKSPFAMIFTANSKVIPNTKMYSHIWRYGLLKIKFSPVVGQGLSNSIEAQENDVIMTIDQSR